jgi:protein SCO1/2
MHKISVSIVFLLMALIATRVGAQPNAPGLQEAPGPPSSSVPAALRRVAFEQRLNEPLPLDLPFRDEDGRVVKLGDYFGARPVVLAFVYYECPMLCTQVLNGLTNTLSVLSESVGREFDVVTVSFDPRETSVLAAGKKKAYLDRYKREGAAAGWHFLTGDEASIAALTGAAGFRYAWDADTSQFAHASGIVVATPEGRLSRYFFGIEYAPRDLKFALMESSAGKIGSLADQLLLYCYHYDPVKGSYSFIALNALRLGGAVTVVALVSFIVVAIRREHRAGH